MIMHLRARPGAITRLLVGTAVAVCASVALDALAPTRDTRPFGPMDGVTIVFSGAVLSTVTEISTSAWFPAASKTRALNESEPSGCRVVSSDPSTVAEATGGEKDVEGSAGAGAFPPARTSTRATPEPASLTATAIATVPETRAPACGARKAAAVNYSKEWCENMAKLEGDREIGAGFESGDVIAIRIAAMERDEAAMKRRDVAYASGAAICGQCGGNGTVWQLVDGKPEDVPCPRCEGETWIDADGRPYKID